MKQNFLHFLVVVLCITVLFSACKKSDSAADNASSDVQIATQTDDETLTSSEMDAVAADANLVLESDVTFSGNNAVVSQVVCDADVAINKDSDPMTMTITYNGAACTTAHTRTGVVVIAMAKGAQWKNTGAAVTVTFNNLKIRRNSDKKTVTLNGTHTYINVSGGLLSQLATIGSVLHTVTSNNMSIAFDNNTARTWNIARQMSYTYENSVVLTITGTHEEGSVSNIAEWGTNRYGKTFITAISAPLIFKQDCDFRLTSGAVTHTTLAYTATATFGLDAAGAATGCPGSGHYFYQLVCTRVDGKQLSIILPY